ncbi:MAG: T9SS type A sorting domain-containing protein [Ignavibacteriales bacterium]|nr:T9SS type A sorting domain-containing protein [Ignavibacteriales bacterium]
MKKIFIVFVLLLQGSILSQTNFIRQITSGDFDARNPFIYKDEYDFTKSPVFFELHKENFSNIYYKKYNPSLEEFEDTVALTWGSFVNLNPSFHPNIGLIYQTNQSGNFDIVFIPDSEGVLGNTKFLTTSTENEINPKFFEKTEDYDWFFQDSTNLLFMRNNDIIYLNYKNNIVTEEVIFHSDSQFIYSDFLGIENNIFWADRGFYIFAIESENPGIKRIVRKYKPYDGQVENKIILKDSCNCNDLSLQYSTYNILGLFYTDIVQDERRYYVIEYPYVWLYQTFYLNIEHDGNLSDFDVYRLNIITQRNEKFYEPDLYTPYSYSLEKHDSIYVRFNIYDLNIFDRDSLHHIAVENPNLAIGSLGSNNYGIIVYTVWEDSIDGHIQLFGTPAHLQPGAVDDESIANDFVLYQNYPNPFNPETKIEYKLLQASDVKFNVFNILGEKVFEQNFGYQTAGSYKVNFDGENLPSGVYVYSIYTNENRLSRKMMLMK